MMLNIATLGQLGDHVLHLFDQHLHFLLGMVLFLLAIQVINASVGYRLNILGIYPRRLHGLLGIPLAPFLHGNFSHLLLNLVPLFLLVNFVLALGFDVWVGVTCMIVGLSGVLIWLLARPAFHVGASAVVMGYLAFIFASAYYQRSLMSIVVAALCVYYFGASFVLSMLPTERGASWEGHIFGALAGWATAVFWPYIPWLVNVL